MMVSVELVKFNTTPVILIEVVVFSEHTPRRQTNPSKHIKSEIAPGPVSCF